jgi:hypothetical protein
VITTLVRFFLELVKTMKFGLHKTRDLTGIETSLSIEINKLLSVFVVFGVFCNILILLFVLKHKLLGSLASFDLSLRHL